MGKGKLRTIYFTHCSSKKDDSLKGTGRAVLPEELYISKPIQGFIKECKGKNVEWAIFSDLHGIWFPRITREWYEKSPRDVSPEEFDKLVNESFEKLKPFDKIYFYANYRSSRFSHLYARLKKRLQDRGLNIQFISHKADIG